MNSECITGAAIDSMEQRYRATFINSIGGFKAVCLVGTVDKTGHTNLAIFSSFFHIGAHPPLCGLIFRPDTVHRHTLDNIMSTGAYTINHLREEMLLQAHQTSARYERDVSEFDATGLCIEYHAPMEAPYVAESHIKIGMKMLERIDLAVNGTILLIGQIEEARLPADCIGVDGFVDLEKAGTLTLSGLDSYHSTRKLGRLSYAKVGSVPRFINK